MVLVVVHFSVRMVMPRITLDMDMAMGGHDMHFFFEVLQSSCSLVNCTV